MHADVQYVLNEAYDRLVATGKLDVSTLLSDDVMWTLLGTLYLRAYESRSPRSILRDHYAAEALDRIAYDEPKLAKRLNPKANQFLVALRAKQLDRWTTEFLDRHPDATVLQLGCGLDSRVLRLGKPATATSTVAGTTWTSPTSWPSAASCSTSATATG